MAGCSQLQARCLQRFDFSGWLVMLLLKPSKLLQCGRQLLDHFWAYISRNATLLAFFSLSSEAHAHKCLRKTPFLGIFHAVYINTDSYRIYFTKTTLLLVDYWTWFLSVAVGCCVSKKQACVYIARVVADLRILFASLLAVSLWQLLANQLNPQEHNTTTSRNYHH